MNIEAVYRKATWRIVPLLFLCYVAAFVDRINIGYAQLQMKDALGFNDAVYGFGAGIFFLTYVIFEIPSNLLMARMGVRKTLFRIMSLWGLVSMATAFVKTPQQFYAARLLLGVFEAGFFPAVMLYLSYWFPATRIARITALFMTAVMVAGLVAGPISGWILQNLEGVSGLRGWQWLFILEGIPSLVLAGLAACFLADRPASARWLTEDERDPIESRIRQAADLRDGQTASFAETVRDWRLYAWGLALSCVICAGYGVTFWLPQMIRAAGGLDFRQTGLYSAIPYVVGLVAMLWTARHAEQAQEYRWHYAAASLLCAAGLGLTLISNTNLPLSLFALSLANAGLAGALPVFWAPVVAHLSSRHAPIGIAIITSMSVAGGALSPMMVGWAKTSTGDIRYGMLPLIALAIAAAVVYLRATPKSAGRLPMALREART